MYHHYYYKSIETVNCKSWNIRATVAQVPYTKVLTLLNRTLQTMLCEVCTVQFQMYFKWVWV